jgi:cation/acetate symporter
MNGGINPQAVMVFALIVGLTLALSFYLGSKAKSAKGFFAAGGDIPWFINGIAFAGDYLSAASFLGICGMIAFYGYDGFLYSIGYLAGWVVALFVVAEPLKRLGKYTFADALAAKYDSRGITAAAGLSTLVVSLFYLIPQMVGAGVLVKPLLGLPHWAGVIMVGTVVIIIVMTAGMVSTTYVQFLKGLLLVFFSTILTVLILQRGLEVTPKDSPLKPLEAQSQVTRTDGQVLINGLPKGQSQFRPVGHILELPGGVQKTGPLTPWGYLQAIAGSKIVTWSTKTAKADDGTTTVNYTPKEQLGADLLQPGNHPTFAGLKQGKLNEKLNFISLLLALFCGTASLPHILIRYYTVRNPAAARKSTIVGIGSIGFFYVLTLYLGLGAMTSGSLDVTNSNMAAPLLARAFSDWLFAIISAIAFTTVLGTVSGLIIAASGAVVHDLMTTVFRVGLSEQEQVSVAKLASVAVGAIAIILGIIFEKLNVSYLVGWAFSVAASANLPSLIMLLFWKRTTSKGIIAAILVGMCTSLGWILLSSETYKNVYGLDPLTAPFQISQPGLVTIPLGFLTLVVVSLMTKPDQKPA